MLRALVVTAAACSVFLLASAGRADAANDFGLPIVAPESQPSLERAPEPQPQPNDERWLSKPFSVGLSAIMGFPGSGEGAQADEFLMPGAEFAYALPNVSLAATLGYLYGLNASLAARGRLHLGHTVALTLGARAALLPLDDACGWSFSDACKQWRHWDHALFGGGEFGLEGRTEAGFMWRAQLGVWAPIAHGDGTCKSFVSSLGCAVGEPPSHVFITQELTLGWAF